MKKFLLMFTGLCILPMSVLAHGPSPQKVVKEIVIKAEPARVWALVKDFGAIGKWHPDVVSVKTDTRADAETGVELLHREVVLKNGNGFLEKLREVNDASMKVDYKMLESKESTIPVSNYRTVIQVKPGVTPQESILTITARFYNKANSMEAPPGSDNPAANKAINELYDAAMTALKAVLEGQ
ncbi:MAG: SRPBCC family protein [Methylotenera sp.]|jgi:hypothetical protein|nr:SRPBCC family protein [Methylotenera sp.]